LDPSFAQAYRRQLEGVDLSKLIESFRRSARVALLCVEAEPAACHRSLLATEIAQISSVPITHL
jgi:uncharacterized protein (DUF488 family)